LPAHCKVDAGAQSGTPANCGSVGSVRSKRREEGDSDE
jgi:hypothetical protein